MNAQMVKHPPSTFRSISTCGDCRLTYSLCILLSISILPPIFPNPLFLSDISSLKSYPGLTVCDCCLDLLSVSGLLCSKRARVSPLLRGLP